MKSSRGHRTRPLARRDQSEGKLLARVGARTRAFSGFATGFGFRVTSLRRPAVIGDPTMGDTEIALVLPLEDDPHTIPNATSGVIAIVIQSTDAGHRAAGRPCTQHVARTGREGLLLVPC
jgi:hypothetical protein